MRSFLELLFKHAECLTNDYAAEEARGNLALKSRSTLPQLATLLARCKLVPLLAVSLEVDLKEKDLPILAGAVAGKATHLLTGDKQDFGHLCGQSVYAVKIVSPRMLADECVPRGWL